MPTLIARLALAPAVALAPLASALAQTQPVKPPIAQYWVSVQTAAAMSLPGVAGLGGLLGGMMGGSAAQGGRSMVLQLGSQQPASGVPRAEHAIPAGMNMGPALPLVTPERPVARVEPGERDMPQGMEQPKSRMLIYWGCGEKARPGQPVIIDYAKMAQGQAPKIVARRVSAPNPPSPGRNKTYGDWPNREMQKAVPENASLRGEHTIKGTYSPDIRFSLGEGHDFMPPVALASSVLDSGAANVGWKPLATATGYFAAVFGAHKEDEMVFWSSSEVQEMGGMLMDYLPPAEVARLVREKVVLAPSVAQCAVPAEVIAKAGGAPLLNFIAYGPEANFAQPPQPQDPKVTWEPLWTAKVRFKSTASLMLGQVAEGAAQARRDAARDAESASQPEQPAQAPAQDPIEQGIRTLRGIFGR